MLWSKKTWGTLALWLGVPRGVAGAFCCKGPSGPMSSATVTLSTRTSEQAFKVNALIHSTDTICRFGSFFPFCAQSL